MNDWVKKILHETTSMKPSKNSKRNRADYDDILKGNKICEFFFIVIDLLNWIWIHFTFVNVFDLCLNEPTDGRKKNIRTFLLSF